MTKARPSFNLDLVWLAVGDARIPVHPRLFQVLEAVQRTGKLAAATREVGLSYRQTWGLITEWSDRIGRPLVVKQKGRGTELTPVGELLVSLNRSARTKLAPHLESVSRDVQRQLRGILNDAAPMLSVHASHDLALGELRSFLHAAGQGEFDLHVTGSLESVMALFRARCDVAGFHVPQGALGRHILAIYEPLLKPRAYRLVHVVQRTQGLMVAHGNPLGLNGIADLARTKARFINRQRGSGTQIAFDQMLENCGISTAEINGYQNEEFTHMAVAAAVAGGVADAGLGIAAAAAKLSTGFVPLFKENYHLLARRETSERAEFVNLLSVLRGDAFREIVSRLVGYDASRAGSLVPIDGSMCS